MFQGRERRQYYREALQMTATFRILSLPSPSPDWSKRAEYKLVIRDLSGGGCRIGTVKPIPVGARICIDLPMGMTVTGEVVYRLWLLTSGIRFLALTEEQERKIIAYVFKMQQKKRQIEARKSH